MPAWVFSAGLDFPPVEFPGQVVVDDTGAVYALRRGVHQLAAVYTLSDVQDLVRQLTASSTGEVG